MSDYFSRTKALYLEACERPPGERARYLEEACEDPELRAAVLDLLSAGEIEDGFLDPPKLADSAAYAAQDLGATPDVRAGTRIGAFTILRHVASGGMGEVFEAEQDDPRRRVALKTMRHGFDREGDTKRFRREAELLAKLKHPGIAQIHESGVHVDDSGGVRHEVPYFAMELVEGARTLSEYADAEGLSADARIALFCAVCDAVAHGNRLGVVHRDIKMDNLLVDAHGRPKVIDFGVARASGSELDLTTFETRADLVLGTLATMSPEQVAGNRDAVDARSDVYALGVVLFELLSGARPLDLADTSLPEAARRIREEAPTPLRRANPGLGRDLETIVGKALEKDPARRYASADALAEDLRRYLAEEPIHARPPSATYRAGLFLRRNRAASIAGAAVLAIAVGAFFVTRDLESRAEESETARDTVTDVLLDRELSLTSEVADRLLHIAGGLGLTIELVESAVADLEAMLVASPDDERLREQVARAYVRLGDSYGNPIFPNLGERARSDAYYARAFELVEGLDMERPGAKTIAGICRRKRADQAFEALSYEDALADYLASLALFEEVLAAQPDDWNAKKDVATAHDALATAYGRMRDMEKGDAHVQRAIELYTELREERPGVDELDGYLAGCLTTIGGAAYVVGDYATAIPEYTRAIDLLRDVSSRAPASLRYKSQLAWATMWRGSAKLMSEQTESASADLAQALAYYGELRAAEPDNTQHGPMMANLYQQLAGVARNRAGDAALPAAERDRARAEEEAWLRKCLDLLLDLEERGLLPAQLEGARERIAADIEAIEVAN